MKKPSRDTGAKRARKRNVSIKRRTCKICRRGPVKASSLKKSPHRGFVHAGWCATVDLWKHMAAAKQRAVKRLNTH